MFDLLSRQKVTRLCD